LKKSAKGPDDFRSQGARRGGRLNSPYSIHDRIKIVVADEKADEAANIILEHAATGLAGDGLVAVAPVDYAVKIRTKERLT
jgi:nitrogen regulatory protein P-II 1